MNENLIKLANNTINAIQRVNSNIDYIKNQINVNEIEIKELTQKIEASEFLLKDSNLELTNKIDIENTIKDYSIAALATRRIINKLIERLITVETYQEFIQWYVCIHSDKELDPFKRIETCKLCGATNAYIPYLTKHA